MKLFVVLAICMLGAAAAEMNFDEEMAEIAKLDQQSAELTPDDKEAKEDFHYRGHRVGNSHSHKSHSIFRGWGDHYGSREDMSEKEKSDFHYRGHRVGNSHSHKTHSFFRGWGDHYGSREDMSGKEKSDFYHRGHRVGNSHSHKTHSIFRGWGDHYGSREDMSEKEKSDKEASDFLIGRLMARHHRRTRGDEDKEASDFLIGRLMARHHRRTRGDEGVVAADNPYIRAAILNRFRHPRKRKEDKDYYYPGDVEDAPKEDFLLGLAHHYVKGCVGVLHHAVNFVGGVLGDEAAKGI